MISYKGTKCFYLGLKRWRVQRKGWSFDIFCRGGIAELIQDIERWELI